MKEKYHILVADDETSVREILRDLILALGNEYIVYTAADSYEALHMLQSLPLDLAFIDINMPGINGFQLLQDTREKYREIMMVIITGQPSYSMVLEALRLGAEDFLAKPISLAELRQILSKVRQTKERRCSKAEKSLKQENLEALTQEMHHKIKEQHFLHSLSEKLGHLRNTSELYFCLTDMALTLTGGREAAFYRYDSTGGRLRMVSLSEKEPKGDNEVFEFQEDSSGGATISMSDGEKLEKRKITPAFLSLPLRLRGELMGVLQIYGNPQQSFRNEIIEQLQLMLDRSLLTLENLELQESVSAKLYDTLTALINSLEARDSYSRHHSVRVTHIAAHFAEKIPLSPELVDSLRLAGPLHDIGKIGIPDGILLKPSRLTPDEMEVIRQHTLIGEKIVAPLNLLPRERAIILHHHERWDGKGYPMGLKGDEIPFLPRIIAIADAYDAITSDRPYRQHLTHAEALREIKAHYGTQFDPDLALQFVDIMSQPGNLQEIFGLPITELADQSPQFSDEQLYQLKKKFCQKLPPLNGCKIHL
ncbi:MAG: response regulator [Deltaproteobacteria bacterium]|nr:response regulator [Deltaproteobacteria bacterium]